MLVGNPGFLRYGNRMVFDGELPVRRGVWSRCISYTGGGSVLDPNSQKN